METVMESTAADCAAGAFASTFSASHPHQHVQSSAVSSSGTSNNLPAELLLIIFKLVYEQEAVFCVSGFPGSQPAPYDARERWPWEVDMRSLSLFPYAIAAVYSLWRDVMSLVPEFWTRVVIFVDSPTQLSAVASQLSWSCHLPLNVVLTRRTFDGFVDGPVERSLVASILKLIHPHIHHVQQLHFDVMYSSSLPSFPHDFQCNATSLKTLWLECREDDGGSVHSNDNRESFDSRQCQPFQCPKLVALVIDGRNCYHACKRGVRWMDKVAGVHNITV